MIEKYDFGVLQLDGREYCRDVIIYPEDAHGARRVNASWWRREGHRLDCTDLDDVVKARPEVLIVGTGYNGCMKVPKETTEFLKNIGIEVYAGPTKEACRKFNELRDVRRVVAALHLTC